MTRMADICAAVARHPRIGLDVPGIIAALGATCPRERNSIGAAVCTLLKAGKLRHNNQPARGGRRYFATATTLSDLRRNPEDRPSRRQQQLARAHARVVAQVVKDAPKPPKPPKSADLTIVRKPEPVPTFKPAARAQSVEEFLAAGGAIQHLPPHASGQPLRFDHSDTRVPTGRRRPVTRARPHASHA